MKNSELLAVQLESENTENNNSSTSKNTESNEGANQQIIGTPLIARTDGKKWFATVGIYRLSKSFETYEELIINYSKEKQISWEELTAIINAIMDFQEKQLNQIKEIGNQLEKTNNN